jgi:hypothetical protein
VLSKARDYADDPMFLFHSRRIGKKPSYLPSTGEDEYVKIPANTTILTALKLSGKTKEGLSIGVLDAWTDNEYAAVGNSDGTQRIEVEPTTNYFIGRLQKDFDDGNTIIGGIVTATNRKLDDAHPNIFNSAAYTGGIDFQKFWGGKSYRLNLKAIASQIRGSKEAITLAQMSSRRYFQRPDASHLQFDPEKTSLSGYGGIVTFEKKGKGHWNYSANLSWHSPGLDLNDVGYLRVADRILAFFDVSYNYWKLVGIVNEITVTGSRWDVWNFGREKVNAGTALDLNIQFKNFWTFNTFWEYINDELDMNALRGGPAMRKPSQWFHATRLKTDPRNKLVLGLYHHDHFGKCDDMLMNYSSIDVMWKPSRSFQFSVKPGYYIDENNLQYVKKVSAGNDPRYVMGRIKLDRLSLTIRFSYGISPKLSIQYYAQPFISSGKYSKFKFAKDTRAKSYLGRFHEYSSDEIAYDEASGIYKVDENKDGTTDYSFANPDFNFFQFRSNLVIRWEFSHGSTLFLIWSQDRTGDDLIDGFNVSNGARELFNIRPDNVLLFKVSKRFSL